MFTALRAHCLPARTSSQYSSVLSYFQAWLALRLWAVCVAISYPRVKEHAKSVLASQINSWHKRKVNVSLHMSWLCIQGQKDLYLAYMLNLCFILGESIASSNSYSLKNIEDVREFLGRHCERFDKYIGSFYRTFKEHERKSLRHYIVSTLLLDV